MRDVHWSIIFPISIVLLLGAFIGLGIVEGKKARRLRCYDVTYDNNTERLCCNRPLTLYKARTIEVCGNTYPSEHTVIRRVPEVQ